jgi:signal transduction histidine kinase
MRLTDMLSRFARPVERVLVAGLVGSLALFIALQQMGKQADRNWFEAQMTMQVALLQQRLDDAMFAASMIMQFSADQQAAIAQLSNRSLTDFLQQRYPYIVRIDRSPGGIEKSQLESVPVSAGSDDTKLLKLVLPLARPDHATGSAAERPEYPSAVAVWVATDALCKSILDLVRPDPIVAGISVHLFARNKVTHAEKLLCPHAESLATLPNLIDKEIHVGDLELRLAAAIAPALPSHPGLANSVLLIGLSVTALLGLLAKRMEARERTDRHLVTLRTEEMKRSHQMLLNDMKRRKTVEHELHRSSSELRRLAEHQANVKEEERKRIAREIHDDLGQILLALRIDLLLMVKLVSIDDVRNHIVEALGKIDFAVKSVKMIINDLRPAILDSGLHAAVEWEVNKFRRQTGVQSALNFHHDEFELDDQRATTLFRIVQESLTNIARHARASAVTIDIWREQNWLFMKISDNGIGMDSACRRKPESFGLIGISERVYAMGGAYDTESAPHSGTTVTIAIPLGAPQESANATLRA